MKLRGVILACAVPAAFSLGCSDPVPAKSQGSFAVTFQTTSDRPDGSDCESRNAGLPSDPNLQPGEQDPGGRLVDGASGANVACQVTPAAEGAFKVSARVSQGATSFFLSAESIDPEEGGEAFLSVNFQEVSLESNVNTFGTEYNRPCFVKPIVDQNTGPQIAVGKIWATFTCPGVGSPPATYCAVNEDRKGVFVMEKCAE